MIWGGARAKAGKKKLNGYSPGKKNSTQQPGRKPASFRRKKNSSAGWPGKEQLLSRLARKKKTQHEFSAQGPPPDH